MGSIMEVTELNEPVEVRADFRGGTVLPEVFRRNGEDFAVHRVHAVWRDTEGEFRLYFYAVEAAGAVYQLRWRTQDNLWFIDHVIIKD